MSGIWQERVKIIQPKLVKTILQGGRQGKGGGRGAYLASGKGNRKSSSPNSSRSSHEGEGVIALNAAEAHVVTDEKDWRMSTLEPSKLSCKE